jgi:N-acetylglutamate synthase-like GNAT family acetyltransferase
VAPKYRGKSFNGTKLGEHMLLHARKQLQRLGYKEAYLFTEKNAKYYVRNGWVEMGITQDEKDNNVCLCKLIVD